MMTSYRKGFTMIELVFVIVVIGILSAIAIPKLAATRDDAVISKARTTVASVRSAIATERQKRILRGVSEDFIDDLGEGSNAFSFFDGNTSGTRVLEYPIAECASGAKSCWTRTDATHYTFTEPSGTVVSFELNTTASRFDCTANCENFK